MLVRLLYIILFVFMCVGVADAQVAYTGNAKKKVTKIMEKIVEFNAMFPQEKVYLHLDNTGYFKGEDIWFSAFCKRTDKGIATDISRVLYVELLTPEGDLVERQKLMLTDGWANGCFHLNKLLNSGFYEIRAYTRYMLNWSDVDIFSMVLPIFNEPQKKGDFSNPTINKTSHRNRLPDYRTESDEDTDSENNETVVRFYPEGGSLVEGLSSRVAYTVIQGGKELERGITECTPNGENSTFHYGGMVYDMPEAKPEGCVVRVDTYDDYEIKTTFTVSKAFESTTLAYLIMNEGNIHYADTFTASPSTVRTLPRYELPDGVNRLVVFDTEGRIFCDRLLFKCPEAQYQDSVEVTPMTGAPSKFGKVRFDLRTLPNTMLSLSVTDANTATCGRSGNIKSWMLLSSEVKGYIANPDYYFEADDEVHRRAADLLMMVQGWRRYDWDTMVGKTEFANTHPTEDRLYLRGKLIPKKEGVKPSYLSLSAFLWNSKGSSSSGKTATKKDGSFLWAMPGFRGDYNLQINIKKEEKNDDFYITIDRNFAPKPRGISRGETDIYPFVYDRLLFDEALLSKDDTIEDNEVKGMTDRNHLLGEVRIEGKKRKSVLNDRSKNSWYDESFGKYYSSIMYDCDAASEEIADKGEEMPTLYKWLSVKNRFFINTEPLKGYYEYVAQQPMEDEGKVENDFWQTNTLKSPNLYRDGFSYKNRKIIWILNNKYAGMTNMGHSFKLETLDDIKTDGNEQDLYNKGERLEYKNFRVSEGAIERMPLKLSEVKSVYISENPEASTPYLLCGDAQHDAVTIFVFSHPYTNGIEQKGVRRTHFQGYNEPQTFQMEDYSVLPPREDFRRTLDWNPNVKTDSEGKATIEFYNNSSCTEMFISAEGMTKDGRFVVY